MNDIIPRFLSKINGIIKHYNLKPLSKDGRFVYVPTMNDELAIKYHIQSGASKVLIVDTLSGYFNATLFLQSHSEIPDIKLSVITSNYKRLSQVVYDTINQELIDLRRKRNLCFNGNPADGCINKYEFDKITKQKQQLIKTPAYNHQTDTINTYYTIASEYPECCRGMYMHPAMFNEILLQTNPLIYFDIVGMNLENFVTSPQVNNRNELSKLHNYAEHPVTHIKLKYAQRRGKNKADAIKDKVLTVLVRANYDDDYPYKGNEYKLSLLLVSQFDKLTYMNMYDLKPKNMTDDELFEHLENGDIPMFGSEIIFEVVSLCNVPTNFAKIFYEEYQQHVDMEYTDDDYILTTELEQFKVCLSDYLLEYMMY